MNRGFSLIEVLIALAVFAFATMGLFLCLQVALETAGAARFETIVRQRMEDQLARVESGKLIESKKVIELESPSMKITQEIRRENINRQPGQTPLAGLWRVTLHAEWEQAGQKQKSDVSILRYSP